MNYNELMVGDWVKDTKNDYYYQFESLWSLINAEDYEPIPITEEILKKNGFNLLENKYSIRLGELEHLAVLFDLKKFNLTISNSIIGTIIFNNKIEYVHELQHVFRLCKIDKEIIL